MSNAQRKHSSGRLPSSWVVNRWTPQQANWFFECSRTTSKKSPPTSLSMLPSFPQFYIANKNVYFQWKYKNPTLILWVEITWTTALAKSLPLISLKPLIFEIQHNTQPTKPIHNDISTPKTNITVLKPATQAWLSSQLEHSKKCFLSKSKRELTSFCENLKQNHIRRTTNLPHSSAPVQNFSFWFLLTLRVSKYIDSREVKGVSKTLFP